MTPAPIARLLGDHRFAIFAAALLTLPYWTSGIATLIAHPFWVVADPVARFHERNIFLEHAGLIGGLMLAAVLRERPA